jgi:hypothetical protein
MYHFGLDEGRMPRVDDARRAWLEVIDEGGGTRNETLMDNHNHNTHRQKHERSVCVWHGFGEGSLATTIDQGGTVKMREWRDS